MKQFFHQTLFVIFHRYICICLSFLRKAAYSVAGMQIGKGTYLPNLYVTWPHQVIIGEECILERHTSLKFDGIWQPGPSIRIGSRSFIGSYCEFNIRKGISIGNNCLIASGCRFIDHDHGMSRNILIREQLGTESTISIGSNVWLGCNVVVLKGVCIADGAIVAAGAVVTKSIGENEIWAGVPAVKIRMRQ